MQSHYRIVIHLIFFLGWEDGSVDDDDDLVYEVELKIRNLESVKKCAALVRYLFFLL